MKKYWCASEESLRLNQKLKIRLFKVRIPPIVTYRSELWKITRKIIKNLRGFAARCFSSIAPTDPFSQLTPDPPPDPGAADPTDPSLTNLTVSPATTSPNNSRTQMTLRIREEFAEATREIDIISIVEKRRWQWLGHTLRLGADRNAHRALHLLEFTPGSLLQHLPVVYRSIDSAILLASDKKVWNETAFISLHMQYP